MQDRFGVFDVTLITGRSVTLSRTEVTQVFLHPWILLTYSALSMMTVVMDQQPWTQGMPFWLRTAIYFLSSIFGLSVAWMTLMVQSWAVAKRIVSKVYSILFDLTGAFMSLLTTYCLTTMLEHRPNLLSISSAFLYVFYIVIIVHVSILLWSVVIPQILLQLRMKPGNFAPFPVVQDAAHAATDEQSVREEYPPSAPTDSNQHDIILVSGRRLAARSILHICAEGNYIRIFTATANYFEASTMKMILSQMPVDLGLRVHRSHWISYAAIKAVVRDGRSLTVLLTTGIEIPVSRSNFERVKSLQVASQDAGLASTAIVEKG